MTDHLLATGCRTVTLRAAKPADEAFIFSLYASTRDEELAPLPWTGAQKDAFLRMQSAAQQASYRRNWAHADFQVIEVDERPAGRLYVARTRDEIRVLDISLLPQHRGAGIGSGLLAGLLSEGEASGRPVRLHVLATNRALGLYRRLGFTTVGSDGMYLALESSSTSGAA